MSALAGVQPVRLSDYNPELVEKVDSTPYIVYARDAFVHETGLIGLKCGWFQPLEPCETIFKFIGRRWWNNCHRSIKEAGLRWNSMWPGSGSSGSTFNASLCIKTDNNKPPLLVPHYKNVFVITANWDHNYHHFLIDSLSRLVHSVDFLLQNPDIKIHIRLAEQYAKKPRIVQGGKQMRKRVLELLGFDLERFVWGPLLADEVYLPRGIKCNYPIAHTAEIRSLSELMTRKAYHSPMVATYSGYSTLVHASRDAASTGSLQLLIQHRHCISEDT